jgi:hypothetical protein
VILGAISVEPNVGIILTFELLTQVLVGSYVKGAIGYGLSPKLVNDSLTL